MARPNRHLNRGTVVNAYGCTVVVTVQQQRGLFDGPTGVGNALPFASRTDATKKHHYEIPMAGDRTTTFDRYRRPASIRDRRRIRVSSRNRFAQQDLSLFPIPQQNDEHGQGRNPNETEPVPVNCGA